MYLEQTLPDDRLGYVLDVLGLRDPWMHRVDLARATGRPLVLGAHDREIVAQVVADLGRGWDGPPVLLELAGPAGGRHPVFCRPAATPLTVSSTRRAMRSARSGSGTPARSSARKRTWMSESAST